MELNPSRRAAAVNALATYFLSLVAGSANCEMLQIVKLLASQRICQTMNAMFNYEF